MSKSSNVHSPRRSDTLTISTGCTAPNLVDSGRNEPGPLSFPSRPPLDRPRHLKFSSKNQSDSVHQSYTTRTVVLLAVFSCMFVGTIITLFATGAASRSPGLLSLPSALIAVCAVLAYTAADTRCTFDHKRQETRYCRRRLLLACIPTVITVPLSLLEEVYVEPTGGMRHAFEDDELSSANSDEAGPSTAQPMMKILLRLTDGRVLDLLRVKGVREALDECKKWNSYLAHIVNSSRTDARRGLEMAEQSCDVDRCGGQRVLV